MIEDFLKVEGRYIIEIRDKNGIFKDRSIVKNLVTNAGKAQLALLAGDASATPFTYLAVGTSATTPAASDTTLGAEISDSGLARAAGTVSRVTTSVTNDTYQVTYTWTASGTKTMEEMGVFNAASVGTMLSHALTTSKPIVTGDSVTVTYQLKFS